MKQFAIALTILVASTIITYAQSAVDSLVGNWKFNTNFADSSQFSNHGNPINGATFTLDRFGKQDKALRLKKVQQQYIEVPNSPSLQVDNELSISFWAKRNSLGNQDQVLNKGGDWIGGTCNYGLVFSEASLIFIHNRGYHGIAVPGIPQHLLIPYSGPFGSHLPGTPQDTLWHHYAIATKNGESLVAFYVDGKLAPTFWDGYSKVISLNPNDAGPLNIGGTVYYSNNSMDDIQIYKKKLTENEIKAIYCEQKTTYANLNINSCGDYIAPDGSVFSQSGIFNLTIPNSAGCDSIITIDLSVTSVDNSVVQDGYLLTANAENAEYKWLDCNNGFAPIAGQTNRWLLVTANGSYAVEVSQNGCTKVSDCIVVANVGVEQIVEGLEVKIYPNPTNGLINVDLGKQVRNLKITITDSSGKVVGEHKFDSGQQVSFVLDAPPGFYLLKMISSDQLATKVVIRL